MATRSLPYSPSAHDTSLRSVPARLWAATQLAIRVRRTRRLLAEMDARMLADIGVGHGQASFEANRPFWDYEMLR